MSEVDVLLSGLSQRIGHLVVEAELWKARAILLGYGQEDLDLEAPISEEVNADQ